MKYIKIARFRLLSALLATAILANFLSSACGLRKPQAPSWLTDWDIPLNSRTYYVNELLERIDDPGIVIDSVGDPGFENSWDVDTVRIDDRLRIAGIQMALKDSVGIINVPPPNDIRAAVFLDDIVPTDQGFIPPTSFSFVQPLPALGNFTWADVRQGIIDMTFFNAFEIDLDTLIVTVIDSADMHVVGVIACIDGLDYLETETGSLDLAGQRITNRQYMVFRGHTPGGLLINAGPQNLETTVSFNDDIRVTAARARIDEITTHKSQDYDIEDSTRVTRAVISRGLLQCDIRNHSQLAFTATLSSPNFTIDHRRFAISRLLPPNSLVTVQLDLAGYTFIPDDGPEYKTVHLDLTNQTPGSDTLQRDIDCRDSLTVLIDIPDIEFAFVTGQIKPIPVTLEPAVLDIDLPEGLDQASLTRASINLSVYNNSAVPVDLRLLLEGGGRTLNLDGRMAPKASLDAPPQLTVLSLGPEQTADFFNPPPANIVLSGNAVINPDYTQATIKMTDSYYGRMVLSSPFFLAVPDTISITPEISRTTIESDSRPRNFSETVKAGRVEATFTNHLPLGAQVTIFIGTRSDSTLYTDPGTLALGPYLLEPAVVDPDGGVTDSVQSAIAISLDSDQLSLFDTDTLYCGQKIFVLPTGPGGVSISRRDYLGIIARARLQIKFGDNLWGK